MSPGGLFSAGTGDWVAAFCRVPPAGVGAVVLLPPPPALGDPDPPHPASAAASRAAATAMPGCRTRSGLLLCDMARFYWHPHEAKMNPPRPSSTRTSPASAPHR